MSQCQCFAHYACDPLGHEINSVSHGEHFLKTKYNMKYQNDLHKFFAKIVHVARSVSICEKIFDGVVMSRIYIG